MSKTNATNAILSSLSIRKTYNEMLTKSDKEMALENLKMDIKKALGQANPQQIAQFKTDIKRYLEDTQQDMNHMRSDVRNDKLQKSPPETAFLTSYAGGKNKADSATENLFSNLRINHKENFKLICSHRYGYGWNKEIKHDWFGTNYTDTAKQLIQFIDEYSSEPLPGSFKAKESSRLLLVTGMINNVTLIPMSPKSGNTSRQTFIQKKEGLPNPSESTDLGEFDLMVGDSNHDAFSSQEKSILQVEPLSNPSEINDLDEFVTLEVAESPSQLKSTNEESHKKHPGSLSKIVKMIASFLSGERLKRSFSSRLYPTQVTEIIQTSLQKKFPEEVKEINWGKSVTITKGSRNVVLFSTVSGAENLTKELEMIKNTSEINEINLIPYSITKRGWLREDHAVLVVVYNNKTYVIDPKGKANHRLGKVTNHVSLSWQSWLDTVNCGRYTAKLSCQIAERFLNSSKVFDPEVFIAGLNKPNLNDIKEIEKGLVTNGYRQQ